jgi:hypothetical protein
VFINEWMASNTSTLPDSADGHMEDWFELYNAGTNPVDLTGYYLTDNLTNATQWPIPTGTVIDPQGYLLVWADNDVGQNTPASRDLHTNFKLSQNGETICLFSQDGTWVDSVTFGPQTNDVSQGRFPDGTSGIFFMALPTPRAANVVNSNHKPPILAPIGNKAVNEGMLLTFQATATDADADQTLVFSLDPGAPAGATITSAGAFSWTPTEAQGLSTNTITVRVTDNGTPALSDSRTFTVIVNANALRIASIDMANGVISLIWNTAIGCTYKVQYKERLSDTAWTDLGEYVGSGEGVLSEMYQIDSVQN